MWRCWGKHYYMKTLRTTHSHVKVLRKTTCSHVKVLRKTLLYENLEDNSFPCEGVEKDNLLLCEGVEKDISLPCEGVEKDNSLPCEGVEKDNSLPCEGVEKDNSLPCKGVEKDNSLPCEGVEKDNLLPCEGWGRRLTPMWRCWESSNCSDQSGHEGSDVHLMMKWTGTVCWRGEIWCQRYCLQVLSVYQKVSLFLICNWPCIHSIQSTVEFS